MITFDLRTAICPKDLLKLFPKLIIILKISIKLTLSNFLILSKFAHFIKTTSLPINTISISLVSYWILSIGKSPRVPLLHTLKIIKIIVHLHRISRFDLTCRGTQNLSTKLAQAITITNNMSTHLDLLIMLFGLLFLSLKLRLETDLLFSVFWDWNLNFNHRLVFLAFHYKFILND